MKKLITIIILCFMGCAAVSAYMGWTIAKYQNQKIEKPYIRHSNHYTGDGF